MLTYLSLCVAACRAHGVEILDGVYTNPDPRAYPISSYSYMIIPTGKDDPRMTTAKRQTIWKRH